jgi:hypothetical protein
LPLETLLQATSIFVISAEDIDTREKENKKKRRILGGGGRRRSDETTKTTNLKLLLFLLFLRCKQIDEIK